jgi:hypothetical protein
VRQQLEASVLPISQIAKTGDPAPMDAKTNRRNNLRVLCEQFGGQAEVAKRVKTDAAYLSQCLTNWQGRGVGTSLARRIEQAFGKPLGWMDQSQDGRVEEKRGYYGILLSQSAAELGAEWEKLAEPARTLMPQIIYMLVTSQKADDHPPPPPAENPAPRGAKTTRTSSRRAP